MEKRNVVVTGLGAVDPCGLSVEETWDNVKNGRSGITSITLFDTEKLSCKVAGEVKGLNLDTYGVDHKISRKLSRLQKFMLASTIQAVEDAGYCPTTPEKNNGEKPNIASERVCVIMGVGIGLGDGVEEGYKKLLATSDGAGRLSPLCAPQCLNNEGSSNISIYYKIHGTALTVSTACASGTDAIALAKRLIEAGLYDVAITGGSDANLTPFNIGCYSACQALVTGYEDAPEKASRPFDKARAGFVMAEGSATLILESAEHAKARGAKVYAKLLGVGSSSDAYHLTAPLKDGSGAALAIKEALADAHLTPSDIQYYNAHGTSTQANDAAESAMVKSIWGEGAKALHISSTKSMTGHLVGAAGALEAIISIKALIDDFAPPTINLDAPDTEHGCDLDYTANKGVATKLQNVASASLGFGGHNAALIFGKAGE